MTATLDGDGRAYEEMSAEAPVVGMGSRPELPLRTSIDEPTLPAGLDYMN